LKALLIFSGSNDRAIIAFCRYAEIVKIDYAIVANGEEDLIFLTEYKKNVISIREKNHLSNDNILLYAEVVKSKFSVNEVLILPSTEYLNRFLLDNQIVLNSNNITFGLCNKELYQKISDKHDFGTLCKKYEIKTPKEFSYKPDVFPYVIKPKKYFNSKLQVNFKPSIINNVKEEQEFLLDKNKSEFYFQEYIGGKSIYLLYYFFKNGDYTNYSQENLLQQHNGGSMILCKSSNYHQDPILMKNFTKLFLGEGFIGLVMVEVKLYKNQYYMIEANPRIWGPSQLILDAQMSLFNDFSIENKLIEKCNKKANEYINNTVYFWSGGLSETQKNNFEVIAHDYNKCDFISNYSKLLKCEIYLKKDTLQIYLHENK